MLKQSQISMHLTSDLSIRTPRIYSTQQLISTNSCLHEVIIDYAISNAFLNNGFDTATLFQSDSYIIHT